jgi:predicted HAD superfamily hydrolase
VKPQAVVHIGDHWVFDFLNPREIGITAYFLDRARTEQEKEKKDEKFVVNTLDAILEDYIPEAT